MSAHDPCCCLSDLPGSECPVCASIALARGEEKHAFGETWRANLPLVERRNYLEGYADGAAGHRPRYP